MIARALIVAAVAVLLAAAAADARTITWSGRSWAVRNTNAPSGPGPNIFSDSASSVWVDASGFLHMKVRYDATKGWVSSEVFTQASLGAGTYSFTVDAPGDALDPNVTVGMFTYRSDTREYDVELARWGNALDPTNAQYAVQPAAHAGNVFRFASPVGTTTFTYKWARSSIAFSGGPLWSYSGPDLWSGKAPVHINVWQFLGRPPANGQEVEIVFRSFSYKP